MENKAFNKKEINKMYDLVSREISFFTRSKSRMLIFNEVFNSFKTAKEISENSDLHFIIASKNIKDLSDLNFLSKNSNKLILNDFTRFILKEKEIFSNLFRIINDYEDFFLCHDISRIPQDFIMDIGLLTYPDIVKSLNSDIYRTKNYFKTMLDSSENILVIISSYDYDYINLFKDDSLKESNLKMFVNNNVLELMKENNDIDLISVNKNFELFLLNSDFNLTLVICDDNLLLGLFNLNGSYDSHMNLTSKMEDHHSYNNYLISLLDLYSDKLVFDEFNMDVL